MWGAPEDHEQEAKQGAKAEENKDGPEKPFGFDHPPLDHSKVSEFYRVRPVLDRRIHILGLNSTARFVAHSLRGLIDPPPVSLIFQNWPSLEEWNKSAQTIGLITDGNLELRDGYDAELNHARRRLRGKEVPPEPGAEHQEGEVQVQEGESTEPISALIVCTDAQAVLSGLSGLRNRLDKDSVILFLAHGMGLVEDVNREIFPDPETRPRYMLCVNTHATHLRQGDQFTAIHTGLGTMALGLLPHERDGLNAPYSPLPRFSVAGGALPVKPKHQPTPDPDTPSPQAPSFAWTPHDRYLLRTMLRVPIFCAAGLAPPDLLQLQLEKLVVQSIIGPLSTMLDARNGALLYNFAITRNIRLLLSEASLIIRSLPELQHIPNVAQRFDPGRLETLVVHRANVTRDHISPMLADVRRGGRTDIDYLNGWIVKKGEELGVRCFMNYMMVNLVKGKGNMIQKEMGEDVPYMGRKAGEGEIAIKGEGEGSSLRGRI